MKRVSDQPSVLGPGAFQHALIEVKFPEGFASELWRSELFYCGAQGLCALRSFNACQREVRLEGAFFGRNAEGFELHFDRGDERGELRACFDAGPKNTRAARAGKKPEAGETQFNWGKAGKTAERLSYAFDLLGRNLADKFERDVHAFETHPARAGANFLQPGAQLGKRGADRLGHIHGHEQAHAIPSP